MGGQLHVDREDVQIAKMMDPKGIKHVVVEVAATVDGLTLVDREDAQTAKMMDPQDTRNAAAADLPLPHHLPLLPPRHPLDLIALSKKVLELMVVYQCMGTVGP